MSQSSIQEPSAPAEPTLPGGGSNGGRTERYELLERIGVGGMAEVFRAKAFGAHGFEKIVAVKRILPELAARAEFVARFITEAKLAVALCHANIVQVLDLAREEDRLYIAMEHVEGGDLANLLRALSQAGRMPPPLDFALFAGIEMLRGLDYAHTRRDPQGRPLGIVHRDVSPSNLLVSLAGEVKVTDFGIARAALAAHLPERVMGKRRYMAPEQARGEEVDARCDVYSAGAVIYELCTGTPAFARTEEDPTGDDLEEVEGRGLPERPSARRPDLPAALDDVLLRALSPDPAARFASAAEFGAALEQVAFDARIRLSAQEVAHLAQELLPRMAGAAGAALDAALRAELGAPADGLSAVRRTGSLTEGATAFFVRREPAGDGLSRWVVGDAGTGRPTSPAPGADGAAGPSSPNDIPAAIRPGTGAPDAVGALPGVARSQGRRPLATWAGVALVAAAAATAAVAALGARQPDGGAVEPPRPAPARAVASVAVPLASHASLAADPDEGARADSAAPAAAAPGPAADAALPSPAAAPSPAALPSPAAAPSPPAEPVTATAPPSPAAGAEATASLGAVEGAAEPARPADRRATLRVETQPSGARVLIDGKPVGSSPLVREDLRPGRHRVRLVRSGYETLEVTVRLKAGKTTEVSRRLSPEQPFGYVNLFTEPWAYVSCEGKKLGTTPARALRLKAGRRRLVLSNPAAGLRREVTVNVTPHRTTLLKVNLRSR